MTGSLLVIKVQTSMTGIKPVIEVETSITCIVPVIEVSTLMTGSIPVIEVCTLMTNNEPVIESISNGRRVDQPGFGGLQADVPKFHRCVTLVQFMDCQLMAGVDLWRAKLPKVAAEGRIGPPLPSLAASVAAPLEDSYTLRAAKVCSRSRDGSSVGEALRGRSARGLYLASILRGPAKLEILARYRISFQEILAKPKVGVW
ncbi:hypothetical protein PCANC_28376 [Puccinia coronata f. sp. avenae]|uniref:Uncharacterized protein n=1 Tax=Puccinia coronata f. sp. avenae TaxID=200324 RepID=A0A2N5RXH0_9BASI|nr:hypothetical protein PCANC_28376 [Puccinia coronata f. sp. avenae]